jgi:Alpha/beta hydrolase family
MAAPSHLHAASILIFAISVLAQREEPQQPAPRRIPAPSTAFGNASSSGLMKDKLTHVGHIFTLQFARLLDHGNQLSLTGWDVFKVLPVLIPCLWFLRKHLWNSRTKEQAEDASADVSDSIGIGKVCIKTLSTSPLWSLCGSERADAATMLCLPSSFDLAVLSAFSSSAGRSAEFAAAYLFAVEMTGKAHVEFVGIPNTDREIDAIATDPGLLKKHSHYSWFFVPATGFTYPSIRIFYRPHPQGDKLPSMPTPIPLLVFIHGLGGSVAQFHALLTSMVNLAPCLGFDLPGCGLSRFDPRKWNAYTSDALVQLIAIIIERYRDKEHGQGVVLVCHSMGRRLPHRLAHFEALLMRRICRYLARSTACIVNIASCRSDFKARARNDSYLSCGWTSP